MIQWKEALHAAEEAYDVDAVINLLKNTNIFVVEEYKDMIEHVLVVVVPAWITTSVNESFGNLVPAIESFLSLEAAQARGNIQDLFTVLVDTASKRQLPNTSHEMAVRQLKIFLDNDGIGILYQSIGNQSNMSKKYSIESLVTRLCSLPDIVYNLQLKHTPKEIERQNYYSTLAQAFIDQTERTNCIDLAKVLLPKLVRVGQGKSIVKAWLSACTPPRKHYSWLESIPSTTYESLVIELFRQPRQRLLKSFTFIYLVLETKIQWSELLPKYVRMNAIFQHVVSNKLILHAKSPLPRYAIDNLVTLLVGDGDKIDTTIAKTAEPILSVLDTVIQRWSFGFASVTDALVVGTVAQFIEVSFARLPSLYSNAKNVLENMNWIGPLCKGVNDHLNQSLNASRQWGMHVAVALSKIISPESPIQCEESELPILETIDEDSIPDIRTLRIEKTNKINEEMDPDEIVDSDNEYLENIDAISEISLEAYDLSDDEENDTKAEKPMIYLLEALEGLQQDEDRDKSELALKSLPVIIRRHPYDIFDMARELCQALTRLDDSFQTPHFDTLRNESLTGLVLEAPKQSLPTLAAQVFDTEKIFQVKLDTLNVISSAVGQLKDKTLLGLYFYPLFGPLRSQVVEGSLHSLDHVLMAHIFRTLASVLEASGRHGPQTILMAKHFLELIWSQRMHEIPSVRRQVLYGLSRVILVLPTFAWKEEVARLNLESSLVPYLGQIQQWDPDDGCRSAAKLLLSSINSPAINLDDAMLIPVDAELVDINEEVEAIGCGYFHRRMVVILGLGNAADAVEILAIGYILAVYDDPITAWESSCLTAAVFAGMLFGGLLGGVMGDAYGRRPIVLINLAINSISALLSAAAPNIMWLIIFRTFAGVGVGGIVSCLFALCVEHLPPSAHGRYVTILCCFWMIGSIITAAAAWLMLGKTLGGEKILPTTWRHFAAFAGAPAGLSFVLTYFFVPESPRFLISKGNVDKATNILHSILKLHKETRRPRLKAQEYVKFDGPSTSSVYQRFMALWSTYSLRRISIFLFIVSFAMSFGSYGISTWITSLFKTIGLSNPYANAFLYAGANLPGNLFSFTMVDRLGGSRLLMLSLALSALSALLFALDREHKPGMVVFCACLFNACMTSSWNSFGVVSTNAYPLDVRIMGMSMVSCVGRLGAITAQFVNGYLMAPPPNIALLLATTATVLTIGAIAVKFVVGHLPVTSSTKSQIAH
ncbi:synaptic vesicle glycoprotein [Thraustotheca clavata]|uniref:Synaptic vesicle glycoprotein n=1 Tax=Thraustotheca clavata TaxID=74557 RepID=A0A1V9ZF48_9STRA|nr:synaptic vesicle glycoprotein [Thraustotheca clavata]